MADFSLTSVTKTNKQTPDRITVHSLGGIGKTTFGIEACAANNGIFILGEDGLDKLGSDVARFPVCQTWADFKAALKTLMTEKHDYKTVVIDTIDALIPALDTFVVNEFYGGDEKKADAYKSKYNEYMREFNKILKALDILNERGMEIITLSHTVVETHRDPASEAWQRWTPNLPGGMKTSLSNLLYDWSDVVLYATYDVTVDDKKRGKGGSRVAHTEWNPAWDAKNRYSLPEKISFSYKALKELINKRKGGK